MSMRIAKRACPVAAVLAFLGFGPIVLAQTGHPSVGSIQGAAIADTGKPVSGAWITATGTGSGAVARRSTHSARDGSFVLSNLPPGTYQLCVDAPGTSLLDPCRWAPAPVTVTLSAGQVPVTRQIQVATGSMVHVRVNDPNKRLGAALSQGPGQASGQGSGAPVQLSVQALRGIVCPLVMNARDGAGRNYQLAVPLNVALQLSVAGNGVQLEDEQRTAIPAQGAVKDFLQSAADPHHKTHVFTVR